MNRAEWKAFYHKARTDYRSRPAVAFPSLRDFAHNGTLWSLALDQGLLGYSSRTATIRQRIIRDRSPRARAAYELAWVARYRREARRAAYPAQSIRGARACIADCRAMLASASAFHALP